MYHRLGHLKNQPLVRVGDWVKKGQLLGYCGTSGASSGPHAHYDVFNTDRFGYTFYVRGWGLNHVKEYFTDPSPYIKDNCPMQNSLPKAGFGYLQFVREKNGFYYHPGIDVNMANDYGKPILSPVEGRVVYVTKPVGKVWKSLFGWVNWNSGWGNMLVIEMKPGFTV